MQAQDNEAQSVIGLIIEKLEVLHTQSLDFNKSSYSQGRAKPGIANQIQVIIMELKALELEAPAMTTKLVTSDDNGNPVDKVVANYGKQKAANAR